MTYRVKTRPSWGSSVVLGMHKRPTSSELWPPPNLHTIWGGRPYCQELAMFVCFLIEETSTACARTHTNTNTSIFIKGFSQHNSCINWRYLYSFLLYDMFRPFVGHHQVNVFTLPFNLFHLFSPTLANVYILGGRSCVFVRVRFSQNVNICQCGGKTAEKSWV
jgi:hypothetical protein